MSKNQHKGLSRRGFFAALGAGAASAALSRPAKANASEDVSLPEGRAGEELCTLLDVSKCIACGACVDACHEVNGHKYPEPTGKMPVSSPVSRVKIEDWSNRRDVDDRLTPYNWLYIQTAEVEHNGESYEINIPRRCLHCVNPPCADLCPFGAARKQAEGIVRIDADFCFGGAKCRNVCPWHIPQRQSGVGLYMDVLPRFAGNGVMYKCDRCYDRVAQGETPACIEVCPEQVQKIGPRKEIMAEALQLAEERGWYLYGLEENGGTNTIYLSPVPFSELNKAVEKGPGKPHLKPVKNTLAPQEKLSVAVFAAPLAGIAAAAATVIRGVKEDDEASKKNGRNSHGEGDHE
ncbi:MAG: 4Fe-4S dicluster domain-containing protein [Desulfovibrio sp.]|uniref:4Fe-4S dicluster domain-containing protein n=1 Tax=Desulfovibrio sp. 7SRBS1 TaxID=3378064 RepID=UPI003B3C520C